MEENRAPTLPPGAVVLGKCRVEELIGEGAFGYVYRALDTRLQRAVAVKELSPRNPRLSTTAFDDYRRRFEREARVQAQFTHPHVVHVYELGQEGDAYYLLMEYVDGPSLRGYLAEKEPLPIEEAARITVEVLEALEVVHEHPWDIVHRDVKPSNVLLTKKGVAKLADFGIAQVGEESLRTMTGRLQLGTPLYMAPEAARGEGYLWPQADLYSLGCVLFEMVTGEAYKKAQRRRKSLRDLRAETPEWLEQALARALAEEAAERWESATEFQAALRPLSSPPIPSPLPRAGEKRETAPAEPAPSGAKDGVRAASRDGKEIVRVPAGPFLYGDKKEMQELPEFWIDRTPVTNAEYARFVQDTGHAPPEHWKAKTPPKEIADRPVVNVSWHDAVAYAKWAGKRLPTEEEWEKAARGTDGRVYPWGDEFDNDKCNTRESGIGATTAVGRYSPQGDSPYGCVDMAGNVWEWTASDHEWGDKVLRGGSWFDGPDYARAAYRDGIGPGGRNGSLGFRCARSSE
ncbi:MAG: SUMF1/EgtB/PvdO family nonheme iron enzyme [Anaerolineae bacterium]|nr:SUMF1/EgtB/PvdO family nonheme iron enzyme [Anaerolineae bacterium]